MSRFLKDVYDNSPYESARLGAKNEASMHDTLIVADCVLMCAKEVTCEVIVSLKNSICRRTFLQILKIEPAYYECVLYSSSIFIYSTNALQHICV